MATDFSVIVNVRQHFGDNPGFFNNVEPQVPFVGAVKDFTFNCPNVDPSETAILLFQSLSIDHRENVFQINGQQVFGGLPQCPPNNEWNGNVMLIGSQHQLRATNNVLHVEARNTSGGTTNRDDFIIDNVVIMYKTR